MANFWLELDFVTGNFLTATDEDNIMLTHENLSADLPINTILFPLIINDYKTGNIRLLCFSNWRFYDLTFDSNLVL